MTLQFYDWQYQNTGFGRLNYQVLSGQLELEVFTDATSDLQAADVPPLNEPNPDPVPSPQWARVITFYPFIKITSGESGQPFFSTPEARYKFGNYSYVIGTELVILPDEETIRYPYYSQPEFIIYERMALTPFRCTCLNDDPEIIPNDVFQDPDLGSPTPANPWYLTSFYFGSNALNNGYRIALNLSDGVTADLSVSYAYGTLQITPDGTHPDIVFPY